MCFMSRTPFWAQSGLSGLAMYADSVSRSRHGSLVLPCSCCLELLRALKTYPALYRRKHNSDTKKTFLLHFCALPNDIKHRCPHCSQIVTSGCILSCAHTQLSYATGCCQHRNLTDAIIQSCLSGPSGHRDKCMLIHMVGHLTSVPGQRCTCLDKAVYTSSGPHEQPFHQDAASRQDHVIMANAPNKQPEPLSVHNGFAMER